MEEIRSRLLAAVEELEKSEAGHAPLDLDSSTPATSNPMRMLDRNGRVHEDEFLS